VHQGPQQQYERPGQGNNKKHLRSQLGNSDTAISLGQPVSILPSSSSELGAPNDDLAQGHAAPGLNGLNLHMDPCIEAKHQGSVFAVQHEIAAGHEDLSWCGHCLGL